ncbi:hypothetical protein B566_EDAN009853 [Ephemera danica]|nr:hypothetical protein B566_EDAN009853 [Ephemera danica]
MKRKKEVSYLGYLALKKVDTMFRFSRTVKDHCKLHIRLYKHHLSCQEKVPHLPIMAKEVIQFLSPQNDDVLIDMTLGAGGHTQLLLNSASNVKIFGLDRDPSAIEYVQRHINDFPGLTPLQGKFSDLPKLLEQRGVKKGTIDGMLFDFGCSSMQFDQGERGFSIKHNGPLDMRMDNSVNNTDPTAAEVLACISDDDLAKILRNYGEEKHAKKIARAVIESRYQGVALQTTHDLSQLVASVLESDHRKDKLQRHAHSATKVFQALRIFINNEMNEIDFGMTLAHYYLKVGGKLAALTFHSLEDKLVKRHLLGNVCDSTANVDSMKYVDSNPCNESIHVVNPRWKQTTKHVITPSEDEVLANPRSRSAKLRTAIKMK